MKDDNTGSYVSNTGLGNTGRYQFKVACEGGNHSGYNYNMFL